MWRRRRLRLLAAATLVALLLTGAPWLWTRISADGHLSGEAGAPVADVVLVLGTQVLTHTCPPASAPAPASGSCNRSEPSARLAGRLQTTAALIRDGRARAILVSGDGHGGSGDETAVMTSYLTQQLGVDPHRIVADAFGLDTYDSCARARQVYGVTRALVVTQSYHLSRAVTLCRHLGIDAAGVIARCDGCAATLLAQETVRDYFASTKAAWDAARDRPPAVHSPESEDLQAAIRRG